MLLKNRFIKLMKQDEAPPPEGGGTGGTPPPAIDYKAEFERMKSELESLKAKPPAPIVLSLIHI